MSLWKVVINMKCILSYILHTKLVTLIYEASKLLNYRGPVDAKFRPACRLVYFVYNIMMALWDTLA